MGALGGSPLILGWPNFVKPAYAPRTDGVLHLLTPTYGGGSWSAAMPLSNLGKDADGYFNGVRSTDAAAASTKFTVDMQTSRPARVFALIRHTLSPIKGGDANAPTVQVTHGDDATFATFAYQSGFVPVFSAMYAPGSLPTGFNPAWFTGGPTVDDLFAYSTLTFVHVADQNYPGQHTQFEIIDTANGNENITFYDAWVGPAYQPRINMSYGMKLYPDDPSTSTGGDTGSEFWTPRRKRRVAEFQLDTVQTDEALELPFEMQMRQGLTGKVLVVLDPSTDYHMHRLSFPARQTQLSGIEAAAYDRFSVPLRFREVV